MFNQPHNAHDLISERSDWTKLSIEYQYNENDKTLR